MFYFLNTLSTSVFADSVFLKSGDTFSGTIKLLDSKKLSVDTDYGGTLSIDWSKIKTLTMDKPSTVQQKNSTLGLTVESIAASRDGNAILKIQNVNKEVALADITTIIPIKKMTGDLSWKGTIDLSLDNTQSSSSHTSNYNMDFNVQARHGLWRHTTTGSYNRYESDNSVSAHNYTVEYSLDHFTDEHLFWQGRMEYKHDWLAVVSGQRIIGSGPGYQFWDDDLSTFSLTGLLDYNKISFSDGNTKEFLSADVKWDYSRNIYGPHLQFFSDGEVGRPLGGIADLTLDGAIGIRYKLTDWASLNMKYSKELINGSTNQTEYTFGVGVKW